MKSYEQDQPERKAAQLKKADLQILPQRAERAGPIEEAEIAEPQQIKAENIVGEIKAAKAVGPSSLERSRKIRLISDAEKDDILVNRIMLKRLMRAILADEEKAA